MNTLSIEDAIEYAKQWAKHFPLHQQWLCKMQQQGNLALLSGDFKDYAENQQRIQRTEISDHDELTADEQLNINIKAIPIPPITSLPPCSGQMGSIIEAVAKLGQEEAQKLIQVHVSQDACASNIVLSPIDKLLAKGGKACYIAVQKHKKAPDYDALRGICFYEGWGVDENKEKAIECFLEVATTSALAQYYLGKCYENGYVFGKNTDKARQWKQLAAHSGCWQAARELSQNADLGRSNRWISVATFFAKQGNEQAKQLLKANREL